MPLHDIPPAAGLSIPTPNLYESGGGSGGFTSSGDIHAIDIWLPYPMTFTQYQIYIVTSSGNLDIGVYSPDGATKYNSLGATASPGTGARQFAISGGLSLGPGHYLLAVTFDNTTARMRVGASNDVWQSWSKTGGGGYPLASSISMTRDTTGLMYAVMLVP